MDSIKPEEPHNSPSADSKIFTPQGFSSFTANCGIKDASLDLGVVVSEHPCQTTAFFTQNKIPGEPVKIAKKHIKSGLTQAVVVNSKNANVGTGDRGYQNCLTICSRVASEFGIPVESVFPSSTGVIAVDLPMENILSHLEKLSDKMKSPPDFKAFAESIMTTDTFPKYISAKVGNSSIAAVAKGSGMVEPDMATLLSYFFTDAEISSNELEEVTRPIIARTFNSLSIDSDTSTSDTTLFMANGLAGKVDSGKFSETVERMAITLTKLLARDAEGATKLFIVDVKGTRNDNEARKIGKSIINSPLVKTAIYQGDPNWGRLLMAIGKTKDVSIYPQKITFSWGNGLSSNDLAGIREYIQKNQEIYLEVDMGLGTGYWRVYGCDLTEEYVRINAYYTT